uniref:Acyltransferase n=1 Tax=Solanum tuberosum TaxID=4113 RepID=M1AYQ9_SOLTU
MGAELLSVQIKCPMFEILDHPDHCNGKSLVFPKGLPWNNNVYEGGNLLVAEVIAESGLQNPTRAEIVSALLFKCATKAASKLTSHRSMRPSKLVHYLNVRTMTKPRLPRNAIGNLLSVFSVEATNEEETELPRLVRILRKEVEVAYKKDQVEQNELIVEIVESIRKGKLPFETGDDECDMYFCSNVCIVWILDGENLKEGVYRMVLSRRCSSCSIIKLGKAWRRV